MSSLSLSLSLLFFFCSTKRILGISTKSRVDHLIAQTRELECTKEVLPSVINDLGMITTNNNNSNALCIIQNFVFILADEGSLAKCPGIICFWQIHNK